MSVVHENFYEQIAVPKAEIIDLSHLSHGDWEPTYGQYDKEKQMRKIEYLNSIASQRFGQEVVHEDAVNTASFVSYSFDLFNGHINEEMPASFGFMVPTRVQREPSDYDDESLFHFPVLRYFDLATRQRFAATMCPYVADRYGIDQNTGQRGYMLFVPLFSDMISDIDNATTLKETATKIVNDGVTLAKRRLNAKVIGLGASIPGMTMFGKTIKEEGFVTTTGHGGTVRLIGDIILESQNLGIANLEEGIGILGSGAIGGATAEYLLSEAITNKLSLYDVKTFRALKLAKKLTEKYPLADINIVNEDHELADSAKTLVSAVTGSVNLNESGWGDKDLEGLTVIDDSVPNAFNVPDIESRGGKLLFVIGQDETKDGLITGEGFMSGGQSFADIDQTWGCGAEAMSIAAFSDYDKAIRNPVEVRQVTAIGELFDRVGIKPAPAQRLGEYILKSL